MLISPGENAYTSATTTPAVAINVKAVSIQIMPSSPLSLNFEMNNFPQNRRTDCLHHSCCHQDDGTQWISKEHTDVLGIQNAQDETHHNRQGDKNAGSQTALGCTDTHFTVNTKTITNNTRQAIKYLRQVASGFLLDQQCGDKKTYVDDRYTFCEVKQ